MLLCLSFIFAAFLLCPSSGQQWKVTCPGDAVAVGSYPLRCDTYYICVKGAFKLKSCPPGYSYDEILKTCRRHETVYCGGRPTIAAAPDMAHGPENIATFRPQVYPTAAASAAASASASAYTPLFWQPAAPTPPLTMTPQMAGAPPAFTTKAPEIVTVDRPHRIDVFVERIQPYLNTIVVDKTRHVTVTRTIARPNFVDIDIEYKRPVVGKVTINRPVPIINTIFVDKKKQVDVILENVRPVVQTLTVEAPVTIERPNIVEKHQNIDVQVDQKTPSAFVSGTVSGSGTLEASVARRPAGFVSGGVGETEEAGSRPSIVQGASASAQASAQGSAEASGFFNQGQPSEEAQAARPISPTLSSQASAQASAQATGFFSQFQQAQDIQAGQRPITQEPLIEQQRPAATNSSWIARPISPTLSSQASAQASAQASGFFSQFQQSEDIQAGRRPITQGPLTEEQRPAVTNPSWGEGASLLCTTLRICSYPKLAPYSSFVLGRDGASKRANEPWYKSATFVPWIEGEERSSQDEERSIGFQRCRIFSPHRPCDQELEATTFFARRIRCCIKPGYSSVPKPKSVCHRTVDKTEKESSCKTGMVAVPFEGHAAICCPATIKYKEESHCYKLYDNHCSGRYKPMTLEGESICCGADNRIVEAPIRKKKVHMVRKCYVKRVPAPCHFGYSKKYYKTKSVCCGAPFKRPVQEKWSCKVGPSVCSSGYFKKVCKDTSCCCRTWYDGQSRDNIWDEQVFDDVEEPFGEFTDGDQIPVEDLEDPEEERAIGEDCEEGDRCYKPHRVRRCYIRKHPVCRPTYIAKFYHSKAVCCSTTYQSNSYEKDVFKKSEVKVVQKWACKLKQQHSCSSTHAEKFCKVGSCCCRELTEDLRSGITEEEILDDTEVEPAEEYELSDDEIDAEENRSSDDCEEGERCSKAHRVRQCYIRKRKVCRPAYVAKYSHTKPICCSATYESSSYEKNIFKKSEVKIVQKWTCKLRKEHSCASIRVEKYCKGQNCCCRELSEDLRNGITDEEIFDDAEVEPAEEHEVSDDEIDATENRSSLDEDCEEGERCYKPHRVRRCYIQKRPTCRPNYVAKYSYSKAVCCSATYQSSSYEKDVFKKSEVKVVQKWACKLKQERTCSSVHTEKFCKGESCCCRELTDDLRSGITDEEILEDTEVEPVEELEVSDDEIAGLEYKDLIDGCTDEERCGRQRPVHKVRQCYRHPRRAFCKFGFITKSYLGKRVCCSSTYESKSYEKDIIKKVETKIVEKWRCKIRSHTECGGFWAKKMVCREESCCCRHLTEDLREGPDSDELDFEGINVEPVDVGHELLDEALEDIVEDRACTNGERCGKMMQSMLIDQPPMDLFHPMMPIFDFPMGLEVETPEPRALRPCGVACVQLNGRKICLRWCLFSRPTLFYADQPDLDPASVLGGGVAAELKKILAEALKAIDIQKLPGVKGEPTKDMDIVKNDMIQKHGGKYQIPLNTEMGKVMLEVANDGKGSISPENIKIFYAGQPENDLAGLLGSGLIGQITKILGEALKILDLSKLTGATQDTDEPDSEESRILGGVVGTLTKLIGTALRLLSGGIRDPMKDMTIVKNDVIQKHGGKYQIPLNTEMGTIILEVANDGKGSISPENIKIFYAGQPDNDLAGLLGSGLVEQITKILGEALKMLELSKLTGPQRDTDQPDTEESRILGGVVGTLTKLLGTALKLLSGGTRDPTKDMAIFKNDMIQKHGGKYQIPLNTEMGTVMLEVANDGKGSISPTDIKIFYAGQPDNDLAGLLGSGLVGQITKILGEALKMLDLSKLTGPQRDTDQPDTEESRILGGVVGTLTKLLGTALKLLSGGTRDPMKDLAIFKNDMIQKHGGKYQIPLNTEIGTVMLEVANDGKGSISPTDIKIFYARQPDNDLAGLLGSGLVGQITKILGEALKMLDLSKLTGTKQDTEQLDSEESRLLGGVVGTLTKLIGSALRLLSGGRPDPMKDMAIIKNDMIQIDGRKFKIPLQTQAGTMIGKVENDGKGTVSIDAKFVTSDGSRAIQMTKSHLKALEPHLSSTGGFEIPTVFVGTTVGDTIDKVSLVNSAPDALVKVAEEIDDLGKSDYVTIPLGALIEMESSLEDAKTESTNWLELE